MLAGETAMDRLRFATGRSVITAARQAAYEGYKGHGVLYAILEALDKRESGGDEVDLVQLAAYVDLKVPELSEELTGEKQRPHFKIEGNFPIGVRKAGLLPSGTASAIPSTPTHVGSGASCFVSAQRPMRQVTATSIRVCWCASSILSATGL
jgi:hypothetical protein